MLNPLRHCLEQGEEAPQQTIRKAGKVVETFPLMVAWNGQEPAEFLRPGTFPPALYGIAKDTWFYANILIRNPHNPRENPVIRVIPMQGRDAAEYEDVFVRSQLLTILPEEPDATMDDLPKGSWDDI